MVLQLITIYRRYFINDATIEGQAVNYGRIATKYENGDMNVTSA